MGRDELGAAEKIVDAVGREPHEQPRHQQHQKQRHDAAEARRQHDAGDGLEDAGPDHRGDAGFRQARPDQAADQRMRARRRDAEPIGDDLPGDRADQRAEDDTRAHHIGLDDTTADGFGDMQPEHQEGDEIEERRPGHRIVRAQNTGGHDGGDRVRRVIHAVEEVERQRDCNQPDEQRQSERGGVHPLLRPSQTCSTTMPCSTLATSSKRSTTFSR
jgi:hypothetical protein